MNVVICGAGQIGRHAARVLATRANDITVIDLNPDRLGDLHEQIDARSLAGNGAQADVLVDAGCAKADVFFAATQVDEINILSASVAKAVGANKSIARVHHAAYFEQRGLDYCRHLGIDHLVCPEYSTALAIAATLRSPGALAVEHFARGKIEMQQWPVTGDAKAVGSMLKDFRLFGRVVAIERAGAAFIPEAQSMIRAGDVVTLVGEATSFDKIRALFNTHKVGHRRVIILGGTTQSVWLCRALRHRGFSVRLFEPDETRAGELADKLPWVTVLNTDAVHTDAMEQERVDLADAFVALSDDDEQNMLAGARAKSLGVTLAIAVLKRTTYLHLLEHVGIDWAFSPPETAVAELERLMDRGPVRRLASLSEGIAEVYEVQVPGTARKLLDKPLRELQLPSRSIVVAIQRGREKVFVPGANSVIHAGDTVIVIGPADVRKELRKNLA